MMVHGSFGLPPGGGTMSVLMNPGNFEITDEYRACHAAKASSDPGWTLAVAIRTACLLMME
jgi:hypothetical protein